MKELVQMLRKIFIRMPLKEYGRQSLTKVVQLRINILKIEMVNTVQGTNPSK